MASIAFNLAGRASRASITGTSNRIVIEGHGVYCAIVGRNQSFCLPSTQEKSTLK